MTRALERTLRRIERLFVLGPPTGPVRPPATLRDHPGDPLTRSLAREAVGVVAAIAIPLAVAMALVPVRSALEHSISLLMVAPVLVVAVIAGARLGATAAVAAAIAFDVLHTAPYYRLTIDDPDDFVEMVALLVIGGLIGLVTESGQRCIVSARVRQRELRAVTHFLDGLGAVDDDALVERARSGLQELLTAGECRWHPGYHGTAGPVLGASGSITRGGEHLARAELDSAELPAGLEIPAGVPPREWGRFIVAPISGVDVSIEERRAAAGIAAALGRYLDGRARSF